MDDDADDRFILERRLRKAGVLNPVVVFRDGDELIAFCENLATHGGPRPCLLLLDLKMPMLDGIDVLTWLHNRTEFRDLPVTVISSSSRAEDRQHALECGAMEYFEKFPSESELASVVQRASAHPFSL